MLINSNGLSFDVEAGRVGGQLFFVLAPRVKDARGVESLDLELLHLVGFRLILVREGKECCTCQNFKRYGYCGCVRILKLARKKGAMEALLTGKLQLPAPELYQRLYAASLQ